MLNFTQIKKAKAVKTFKEGTQTIKITKITPFLDEDGKALKAVRIASEGNVTLHHSVYPAETLEEFVSNNESLSGLAEQMNMDTLPVEYDGPPVEVKVNIVFRNGYTNPNFILRPETDETKLSGMKAQK